MTERVELSMHDYGTGACHCGAKAVVARTRRGRYVLKCSRCAKFVGDCKCGAKQTGMEKMALDALEVAGKGVNELTAIILKLHAERADADERVRKERERVVEEVVRIVMRATDGEAKFACDVWIKQPHEVISAIRAIESGEQGGEQDG